MGSYFVGRTPRLRPLMRKSQKRDRFCARLMWASLFFCFVFVCLAFSFFLFYMVCFLCGACGSLIQLALQESVCEDSSFRVTAILSVFRAKWCCCAVLVFFFLKRFSWASMCFHSLSYRDTWPMPRVFAFIRNANAKWSFKKKKKKSSDHRDAWGCIFWLQTLNWRHSLCAAHSVCSQ